MSDITISAVKGDRRQSAAINALKRYFTVKEFEFPSSGAAGCDVLFIPMLANEGSFETVCRTLKDGALVLGGRIPESVRAFFESRGYRVKDYADDDALKVRNALPTAEGVIGIAIRDTDRVISGSNVLITGYGCCASQCARLFSLLGAKAVIAARDPLQCESAKASGCGAVDIGHIGDVIQNADIVVNTVPSQIIGKREIERSKPDALFIEIASFPFGIDRQAAAELQRRFVHAPGLPGKCAPITSGEYIADTVKEILLNDKEGER